MLLAPAPHAWLVIRARLRFGDLDVPGAITQQEFETLKAKALA